MRAATPTVTPAVDIAVRHPTGHGYEARIFLCNRPTQGGGLKRQLDKVLATMQGRTCYMLRASDFPCFRHESKDETEVLWGATYRMTTVFLELVFDFYPPELASLPVINGTLDDNYLTGKR